jgi:hypothetical protein
MHSVVAALALRLLCCTAVALRLHCGCICCTALRCTALHCAALHCAALPYLANGRASWSCCGVRTSASATLGAHGAVGAHGAASSQSITGPSSKAYSTAMKTLTTHTTIPADVFAGKPIEQTHPIRSVDC